MSARAPAAARSAFAGLPGAAWRYFPALPDADQLQNCVFVAEKSTMAPLLALTEN